SSPAPRSRAAAPPIPATTSLSPLAPGPYERTAPATTVRGVKGAASVLPVTTAGQAVVCSSIGRWAPSRAWTLSTVGAGRRWSHPSATVVLPGRAATPLPAVRYPATTAARCL